MKKLLLILLCLPILFSCEGEMKEKLPDGDTDVFLYETYEYRDLFQSLENANTYLRETVGISDAIIIIAIVIIIDHFAPCLSKKGPIFSPNL